MAPPSCAAAQLSVGGREGSCHFRQGTMNVTELHKLVIVIERGGEDENGGFKMEEESKEREAEHLNVLCRRFRMQQK